MSTKRKAQTVLCRREGPPPQPSVHLPSSIFIKIWTFVPLENLDVLNRVDKKCRSMYDRIYPSMSVFSEFAEFWNARVRRNYNHPILKDLWSKKVEKIFIGVDDKMEVIKIANDEFRLPIAMEDYMSRLKYVEFFFSGDGISAMVLHRASARAWLAWSEEMQNTNDWAGANDEFEECMKTNIELLSQKHYLSLSIDTVKDIVYQLLAYDGCIEVDYSQE